MSSHKYGAKPKVVDGIRFASTGEANRYEELRLLERGGLISGLELQPKFRLVVNGVKVADYLADFRYIEDGEEVFEDYKGVVTPVYRMKKRLVLALFGVKIRETSA